MNGRTIRTMLALTILGAAVTAACEHLSARGNAAQAAGDETVEWRLPVAIAKDSKVELRELARDLALVVSAGANDLVLESESNPVCCFWIEIDSWLPSEAPGAFLVQIEDHGARIIASDLRQARLAVDAVRKATIKKQESAVLPKGLLTNCALMPGQRET